MKILIVISHLIVIVNTSNSNIVYEFMGFFKSAKIERQMISCENLLVKFTNIVKFGLYKD